MGDDRNRPIWQGKPQPEFYTRDCTPALAPRSRLPRANPQCDYAGRSEEPPSYNQPNAF